MSCPECFKGAVHDHAEPQGKMEVIYGINTYVAGGSDSSKSKSAILYLPDAFGLKLVNNKLLADRYASGTGCKVLVPDVLYGGGADPSLMPKFEAMMDPVASYWDFWGILNKIWAFATVVPVMIPFMVWGNAATVYPTVLKYARDMKKDLPPGGKLGVCGFCWGGYGSTNLCAETATEGGSEPLIGAQFNGHPSQLKTPDMIVDGIAKFNVPYSCAVAQKDAMFNEKLAQEAEAAVRQKVGPPEQNNYEFVIWKNCKHGFCVRADPKDQDNIDGFHGAAKQAIDWFNKFLN